VWSYGRDDTLVGTLSYLCGPAVVSWLVVYADADVVQKQVAVRLTCITVGGFDTRREVVRVSARHGEVRVLGEIAMLCFQMHSLWYFAIWLESRLSKPYTDSRVP
jgi:hypothetical protein